ncbi:MAG: hypothetical protein FWE78_04650, partial [Methanimicrococcus sp.]|nr:hypothetical protein [Methanimicrococcus sp.]
MTKFKAGPNELDCVIIFSKKRKKTLSYTVRYENNDEEAAFDDYTEADDSVFQNPEKRPVLFVRAPASLPIQKVQSVLFENTGTIIELLDKATKKEAATLEKSKQAYTNGS